MNKIETQKELINIAYEIAKKEFHDKIFTFDSLWSHVWKNIKSKEGNVEDWIGNFYIDLIQDPRFVISGNASWRLREFLQYHDYLKVSNAMFLYEGNKDVIEEVVDEEIDIKKLSSDEEDDFNIDEDEKEITKVTQLNDDEDEEENIF